LFKRVAKNDLCSLYADPGRGEAKRRRKAAFLMGNKFVHDFGEKNEKFI